MKNKIPFILGKNITFRQYWLELLSGRSLTVFEIKLSQKGEIDVVWFFLIDDHHRFNELELALALQKTIGSCICIERFKPIQYCSYIFTTGRSKALVLIVN